MDRTYTSDLFLDDQYIPSGNWESQIEEISSTSNCCHQYSLSFPSPYELSQPADDCHSTIPLIPDQDTSNNNENEGPFSLKCRIPVPDLVPVSGYQLWLETSFMCRRNERERQRVRNVNDGFSRLRNHLPRSAQMKRRQSKVETLRHAISYIRQLQTLLEDKKTSGVSDKSS